MCGINTIKAEDGGRSNFAQRVCEIFFKGKPEAVGLPEKTLEAPKLRSNLTHLQWTRSKWRWAPYNIHTGITDDHILMNHTYGTALARTKMKRPPLPDSVTTATSLRSSQCWERSTKIVIRYEFVMFFCVQCKLFSKYLSLYLVPPLSHAPGTL